MSAIRTAATTTAKHTRTLSQPLRRTFYSPFAALQRSPLLTKSPSSSAPSNNTTTTATSGDAAVHEHEREHAARTLYVVSEPNAADFKYGVPAGAYPVAAPYHHMVAANATTHSALENVSPSLTSSTSAHPVLTRAALRDIATPTATATGVGGTGAPAPPSGPRFARGAKGAPDGEGGVDEAVGMVTWPEDEEPGRQRLASRNSPPIQQYGEETGKLGLEEAWRVRK